MTYLYPSHIFRHEHLIPLEEIQTRDSLLASLEPGMRNPDTRPTVPLCRRSSQRFDRTILIINDASRALYLPKLHRAVSIDVHLRRLTLYELSIVWPSECLLMPQPADRLSFGGVSIQELGL